jgi:hypothetical protein
MIILLDVHCLSRKNQSSIQRSALHLQPKLVPCRACPLALLNRAQMRTRRHDAGIDYMHPDLGGGFGPGFKVEKGYDFVGDNATIPGTFRALIMMPLHPDEISARCCPATENLLLQRDMLC